MIKSNLKKVLLSQEKIWPYALTLVGIIFLRGVFEVFSDRDTSEIFVTKAVDLFLHYQPWYLVVFLLIIIIIAIITKKSLAGTFKLAVFFSPVIFVPPLVDIIASSGHGLDLAYLFPDTWKDFFYYIVTMGGSNWKTGVTAGIRVEISLIILGVLLYVTTVTKKLWKGVIASLLSYLVICCAGMAPFLINQLSSFLGMKGIAYPTWSPNGNDFDYQIGLFFFLLLLGLILFIGLHFYRKKTILILKNTRPERGIIYIIFAFLGMAISINYFGLDNFSLFTILLFIAISVAIYLAWAQAALLNDIADLQIDRKQNPTRALVSGELSSNNYTLIAIVFIIISLISTLYINYSFFIFILACIVITLLYSYKPFRLRRWPVISNFLIATVALLCTLAGYTVFSPEQKLNGFPVELTLLILILVTSASIMKDLKDIQGDRSYGIRTIPNIIDSLWNKKLSYKITGVIVAASFCVIPIVLREYVTLAIVITTVIFASLIYYVIAEKRISDKYYLIITCFFLATLIVLIYTQGITF